MKRFMPYNGMEVMPPCCRRVAVQAQMPGKLRRMEIYPYCPVEHIPELLRGLAGIDDHPRQAVTDADGLKKKVRRADASVLIGQFLRCNRRTGLGRHNLYIHHLLSPTSAISQLDHSRDLLKNLANYRTGLSLAICEEA